MATLVLLTAAIASFEAISRSGTPREARRPLASLTFREHLIAAWSGLVLLTRIHEQHRMDAHADPDSQPTVCGHVQPPVQSWE